MDHDIAIIGGGIAGASLGAEIADRRRVLILEAEEHCGVHATGRSAAFYLESYGGPDVAKLNRASLDLLADPPADFAETGFLRHRGAIHLSRGNAPAGEGEALDRAALEQIVPGLRPEWRSGRVEADCADIDVARLHAAFLARFRRSGGIVRCGARAVALDREAGGWNIRCADGSAVSAAVLVNAAGAWADTIATLAGLRPRGLRPMRRTMVQLRVGRTGLRDLPLIIDADERFYFKGESDRSIWLSPHDEIPAEPGDAAPEEVDIATAIHRFEQVVDWPVERVERSWAGLRTFAPDRLPMFGFDPRDPAFFWCAGQGGFGIQSSPASARLCAALLGEKDFTVPGLDPARFAPARFG
jgi:D-arginine dehydrogenase